MTKEKQIEEMEIALREAQHELDKAWHECLHNKGTQPRREFLFTAQYLVENKGYRKASDVAREIFADLENSIDGLLKVYIEERAKEYAIDTPLAEYLSGKIDACSSVKFRLAELKKKYESEGTE